MLKFILLFIFIFLVVRTVVRTVRGGLFFIRKVGPARGEPPQDSSSSVRNVEEADYEVLESHINNKNQQVI